jgi:hypothetical protein
MPAHSRLCFADCREHMTDIVASLGDACETYLIIRARLARRARKMGLVDGFVFVSLACLACLAPNPGVMAISATLCDQMSETISRLHCVRNNLSVPRTDCIDCAWQNQEALRGAGPARPPNPSSVESGLNWSGREWPKIRSNLTTRYSVEDGFLSLSAVGGRAVSEDLLQVRPPLKLSC